MIVTLTTSTNEKSNINNVIILVKHVIYQEIIKFIIV